MKIKSGYLVHEVAGNYVVIKIGQEAVNFNGLITISESAKELWDLLNRPNGAELDELVNKLLEEYEIDEETAKKDTLEFIESLKANNILE
jgi:hypothetical protein